MLKELDLDESIFGRTYKDNSNRTQNEYELDKELTFTLVMGYNVKLRNAVVKRWQELEGQVVTQETIYISDSRKALEELKVNKEVGELFGLEGNPLLISANVATRKSTGIDFMKLLEIELQSPDNKQYFTPTEIGKALKQPKTPQAVNKDITALGYQGRINKQWKPTDKGKPLAIVLDTGKRLNNGTMVQQVKWCSSMIGIIDNM